MGLEVIGLRLRALGCRIYGFIGFGGYKVSGLRGSRV